MAELLAGMGMAGAAGGGAAIPAGMASGVGTAGAAGAAGGGLSGLAATLGPAMLKGAGTMLGSKMASSILGGGSRQGQPQRPLGGNFSMRSQIPGNTLPAPVPPIGGGNGGGFGGGGGTGELEALLRKLKGGG